MPHTGPDPNQIRTMFASIANRYDRANTLLSAGIHHVWRRRAVRYAGASPGERVLDCATGTGDLAIEFARAVGEGNVIGTDFVPEMLQLARAKAPQIRFESADVTSLPFETSSFDIVSIAFGIRNVGDPRRAVGEMARVLRPGGRLLILEFGQPRNRLFTAIYEVYRTRILPLLGGMVTGNREAYEYLDRSSAQFASGERLVGLLRESADFTVIHHRALSGGIAYLYRAIKR